MDVNDQATDSSTKADESVALKHSFYQEVYFFFTAAWA